MTGHLQRLISGGLSAPIQLRSPGVVGTNGIGGLLGTISGERRAVPRLMVAPAAAAGENMLHEVDGGGVFLRFPSLHEPLFDWRSATARLSLY
jgi:hypothetical protein